MSSLPLVSILTPVYNGAPYLRQCIESVMAQDHANWEYTIVNNCSTDRTREIALEYASRDSRIRVHDNATLVPIIANHNIAARYLSSGSKYCKFLAADDWLFPGCLSAMVSVAEAHPSVAIVGAYGLREDRVVWDGLPFPSTTVSGRDVCRRRLLDGTYPLGTPTSLLFRADLVRRRDPFLDESNLHADEAVCLDLLRDHDFGFVHQVLTFTRLENESTHSFSERMNTYMPSRLHNTIKYGPVYLTRQELQDCVGRDAGRYSAFLGAAVLEFRNCEFWRFHRDKIRELHLPFRYTGIAGGFLTKLLDVSLHPARGLNTILGRMKAIRRQTPQTHLT